MRLVIGSGNSRVVYDVPHASIINRSTPSQQLALRDNLCRLLGIPA